jgi:superfamily II DNA or RNA helicase
MKFGPTLQDLSLKAAYDSDTDDTLTDFFIPALSTAVKYRRLAGFFSSSVLAIAARGLSDFIKNDGKMQLLCSARLTAEDVKAIRTADEDPAKAIADSGIRELSDIEEEFVRDHVSALGWMVAKGNLEIKVAVVLDDQGTPLDHSSVDEGALFHQKVGIIEDRSGSALSFSGSDNESAKGWTRHVEEFKVFRAWEAAERRYFDSDVEKFSKFWQGQGHRTAVYEVPEAVRVKFVELAPMEFSQLDLAKWNIRHGAKLPKGGLWKHQRRAVSEWNDQGHRGIAEMATGAGKTRVASECIRQAFFERKIAVAVVSVPYSHLMPQWLRAFDTSGLQSVERVIVDSSNPRWKEALANNLIDVKLGRLSHLIILTTNDSLSSPSFIESIRKYVQGALLVADEVHGLGAPVRRNALIDSYVERLGLSATPVRKFDDEGTAVLKSYFGESIGSFSIREGIDTVNPETGETILTPYEYHPVFVELSTDEFEKYLNLSERIAKAYRIVESEPSRQESYDLLLFERQAILNKASAKIPALESILRSLGNSVRHCLIYCAPEQVPAVLNLLLRLGIQAHKFTMQEGVNPRPEYGGISERDNLLKVFGEGQIHALVAIRCLDEGVDVKEARTGIIMASSSNPREFIQRRGRLLRRSPGKDYAVIYDLIATPPKGGLTGRPEVRKAEERIVAKEIERMAEFAKDSINVADSLHAIELYRATAF